PNNVISANPTANPSTVPAAPPKPPTAIRPPATPSIRRAAATPHTPVAVNRSAYTIGPTTRDATKNRNIGTRYRRRRARSGGRFAVSPAPAPPGPAAGAHHGAEAPRSVAPCATPLRPASRPPTPTDGRRVP